MTAYYNEIDPFAAQWLRNLIAAGHIAPGDVDGRSIIDVHPADLIGYTQCHFFAGIGVWSYALRLAGWSDDRQVWTGSCPCQPFSAAGRRKGFEDKRHLWPEFYRLIAAHEPVTVFGEQVASKDGLAWLDTVQADLERTGYACGAVDMCAAGFGAPHIRQRLYFVAQPSGIRCESRQGNARIQASDSGKGFWSVTSRRVCVSQLADSKHGRSPIEESRTEFRRSSGESGGGLEPAARKQMGISRCAWQQRATNGFWNPCDWLPCIDGKARAVEPGTFPLAHGASARVGCLRAYGNAIVAPQAAEFIKAFLDCQP